MHHNVFVFCSQKHTGIAWDAQSILDAKDLTQEIPDIKAAISCHIKAGDHLKVVWAPKAADDFPKLYKLAKIENRRAHKGGRTLVYVCMAESMRVIFFR